MKDTYIRQSTLFPGSDNSILIIGAGGIGSPTALVLAKMGCSNITIVDYDQVEIHNVASQFYGEKDLGKLKVNALKENIEMFSSEEIKVINAKFEKDGLFEYSENGEKGEQIPVSKYDIIIMAVDSIVARDIIFNNVKNKFELLIDGRMGGEFYEIYSVLGIQQNDYLKTLPAPDEIDAGVCTAKAICYNTFGIAANIGALVKKFMTTGEIIPELAGCFVNFYTNKE